MDKWEYFVTSLSCINSDTNAFEDVLNTYGEMGWELFNLEKTIKYQDLSCTNYQAIFKRKKNIKS